MAGCSGTACPSFPVFCIPHSLGPADPALFASLPHKDQHAGLIQAPKWAAVWDARSGAGGFLVTKPKVHHDDPATME
ncbi:hypothetical protein PtA15_1A461 [Puccinia triticina]|uniref:Uncharacterized protein n=1 Tax=Puccinia triticina TaxID=208348 RepID=A0ABY7CB22_9BASI|nr:uncharacterized protein PtA15_1A461 [Puccinia triticina]WAQ81122.1 hypothetical protein PtA15_1A461 [Puccinia triticina]WAR52012.1 hypothetical protein PtB15_1B451 [Puccinia triticina]